MEEKDIKKAPRQGELLNQKSTNIIRENFDFSKYETLLKPAYQIKKFEEDEDFIDGYFPKVPLGYIIGKTKTGKSNFLIHLACCLATQRPFFDIEIKHRYKTLYITNESGSFGVKKRIKAWYEKYKPTLTKKDKEFYVRDLYFPFKLTDIAKRQQLVDIIKHFDINPDLIILDTFRRFMEGDENNSRDVELTQSEAEKFRQEFSNCKSIYFSHHIGREETTNDKNLKGRGSSAIECNADLQVFIVENNNENSNGTSRVIFDKVKEENEKSCKELYFSIDGRNIKGSKKTIPYLVENGTTNKTKEEKEDFQKDREEFVINAFKHYQKTELTYNELKTYFLTNKFNGKILSKNSIKFYLSNSKTKQWKIDNIVEKKGKGEDTIFILTDYGKSRIDLFNKVFGENLID